jgi:hypothetical protein
MFPIYILDNSVGIVTSYAMDDQGLSKTGVGISESNSP